MVKKNRYLKHSILAFIALLITLNIFGYNQWKKEFLLTPSEYSGEEKKANEKPEIFYFSINDQKTFLGKVFIPVIIIDAMFFSRFSIAEE